MERENEGRFGAFHPVVLLVYFAALLFFLMFQFQPVFSCLGLCAGIALLFFLKRGSQIKKMLLFYVFLFLVMTVTNPIFSHEGQTPLIFVNDRPVTLEAVVYGAVMALLLIAVFAWCQCLQMILTSDKLLYLLGKSVPKTALVLTMSIRFLPLFLRQTKKIARVQKAMGLYAGDSLYDKVKGGVRIFSSLVGWSLENAMDTACSMKARGYGLKGRKDFSLFRFKKSDALMLVILFVLSGAVVWGIAKQKVSFSCYPALSGLPLTTEAWAVYVAFGLLAFLPFFIECIERIKWNRQKEKIKYECVGVKAGFLCLSGCKKTGVKADEHRH